MVPFLHLLTFLLEKTLKKAIKKLSFNKFLFGGGGLIWIIEKS